MPEMDHAVASRETLRPLGSIYTTLPLPVAFLVVFLAVLVIYFPVRLSPTQHNPVVGPWATTQNLQLTEQLHGGVRVLDFRVGFVGAEAQKADGVADGLALVHDKHRTNLSLQLALELVKEFVLHHPRSHDAP